MKERNFIVLLGMYYLEYLEYVILVNCVTFMEYFRRYEIFKCLQNKKQIGIKSDFVQKCYAYDVYMNMIFL